MTIVVLLGSPGAGKGTQAPLLAERLGSLHVSTGDLFRAAVRDGTPLGLQVRRFMDAGQLVPDEITIRMLRERLAHADAAGGVILDGFPRNLAQALTLDAVLGDQDRGVDRALYIEIPDGEIIRRMSGRRICQANGHPYNIVSNPPAVSGVCDLDGSPLVQRSDDREDTVRLRIESQLAPLREVVDHYRRAGVLATVDGQRPIEEVTEELLRAVRSSPEPAA